MNDVLTVSNGRIRKGSDLLFVEEVAKSKEKGIWPTIELLMQFWASKAPEEVKAFKIQIDDTRDNLRDKEFGQTPDKNMNRRLTVVFPQALHDLIRVVFPANELKMDKEFFNEFATRFPAFRLPEKL